MKKLDTKSVFKMYTATTQQNHKSPQKDRKNITSLCWQYEYMTFSGSLLFQIFTSISIVHAPHMQFFYEHNF